MSRLKISPSKRFSILNRDNFTCRYCGAKAPTAVLEVDHVKPVSSGGTNDDENLVTSCFECNRGKSDTDIIEVDKNDKGELYFAPWYDGLHGDAHLIASILSAINAKKHKSFHLALIELNRLKGTTACPFYGDRFSKTVFEVVSYLEIYLEDIKIL